MLISNQYGTYSMLANLLWVVWKSFSLTKHLLVILVYDLPNSELPEFPGMNPAYFGMEYDLRGTDFYKEWKLEKYVWCSQ
jgi:hypothetical protein